MASKKAAKKSAKTAPKKSAKKTSSKSPTPLARVRAICLALPETTEVSAWNAPTFRVKNKMFAMHVEGGTEHHGGREALWIYSTNGEQDLLVRAKPDRYFKPPYVGPSGWVGVYLDKNPPWGEIIEIIKDGYRLRAPKKLAGLVD
jgi:hypothetical protein